MIIYKNTKIHNFLPNFGSLIMSAQGAGQPPGFTLKICKKLEKYIRDLSYFTYRQLVFNWKPMKLIMVSKI